jgi:multidrug efflux pump subunit AcrA (membrane-fusion protein)
MTWRRRGPTVVVVAMVVLAVAVTIGYALRSGGSRRPVASTVAAAARGTVTVSASAAGTVSMVTTRGLSFSVAGTVTELDVKVGDQVTAGQVLARIDATDAQGQVNTAQRQLDIVDGNLSKAQSPAPTPTACTAVAPAGLVLHVSGSPSASPSTSTSPSPGGTGSGGGGSGNPSPTASPRPSTSRGAGGTGSCTGTTGGGGTNGRGGGGGAGDALSSAQRQVNNATLTLLQAQQRLAGTTITAPIAGRVITVGGVLGATERPGGTGYIVLGDVSDTEVKAQFSESDVARLAVGQVATVTLANRSQPYTGRVAQISPAGTVSGRLVRYGVLVAFDSVPADLLFGQGASVAVTTAEADGVLCVPSSAVHDVTGTNATVTVPGGHDTVRKVAIGLRGDRYTEIKSGLAEGEQVVL